MPELVIVHHAQGLTPGVRDFAERMRAAGHEVHVPDELPEALAYVGFSLGALPAQAVAQARPGARAVVLYHSAIPPEEFGEWPAGVPPQIHIMDRDPLASPPETDLEAARRLDGELDEATFSSYPGDQHLFADDSLPAYDADAAAQAEARVLELLSRI